MSTSKYVAKMNTLSPCLSLVAMFERMDLPTWFFFALTQNFPAFHGACGSTQNPSDRTLYNLSLRNSLFCIHISSSIYGHEWRWINLSLTLLVICIKRTSYTKVIFTLIEAKCITFNIVSLINGDKILYGGFF